LPEPVIALIEPDGDLAVPPPPAADAAATAGVFCTEAAVLRPSRSDNEGVLIDTIYVS